MQHCKLPHSPCHHNSMWVCVCCLPSVNKNALNRIWIALGAFIVAKQQQQKLNEFSSAPSGACHGGLSRKILHQLAVVERLVRNVAGRSLGALVCAILFITCPPAGHIINNAKCCKCCTAHLSVWFYGELRMCSDCLLLLLLLLSVHNKCCSCFIGHRQNVANKTDKFIFFDYTCLWQPLAAYYATTHFVAYRMLGARKTAKVISAVLLLLQSDKVYCCCCCPQRHLLQFVIAKGKRGKRGKAATTRLSRFVFERTVSAVRQPGIRCVPQSNSWMPIFWGIFIVLLLRILLCDCLLLTALSANGVNLLWQICQIVAKPKILQILMGGALLLVLGNAQLIQRGMSTS